MKIAVAGKGGVGKSTIAATLALLLAERGERVLALDCDPDANLAGYLGMSPEQQAAIVPIARQAALIEERTGAKVKRYGQMFKLNPEVADVADRFATLHRGVSLLVLGAVEDGGSGCACPESVLIRALVTDLVLYKNETLIMDMEAGIEHLGRATARGVDRMVIVVEPGQNSVDCARRIMGMTAAIGIRDVRIVANKVTDPADARFVRESFPGVELLAELPWSTAVRGTDRRGLAAIDAAPAELRAQFTGLLERLTAA